MGLETHFEGQTSQRFELLVATQNLLALNSSSDLFPGASL